jgi:hypothetical protein
MIWSKSNGSGVIVRWSPADWQRTFTPTIKSIRKARLEYQLQLVSCRVR